tara:strand:- start:652 stop:849 length:198 start_codon:yes stop_codon:yes gene_type:complete
MGAKEYLKDKAIYFQFDDFANFEKVILDTWNNTPKNDIKHTKKFFQDLTLDKMVDKMVYRMVSLK